MNERIRELAEKSGISLSMTEFTGCLKGQDYLVTNGNLSEMQLEKFAESIVKECINAIGPDNYGMLTGKANCDKIKRHFGIQ